MSSNPLVVSSKLSIHGLLLLVVLSFFWDRFMNFGASQHTFFVRAKMAMADIF